MTCHRSGCTLQRHAACLLPSGSTLAAAPHPRFPGLVVHDIHVHDTGNCIHWAGAIVPDGLPAVSISG